ncbi:MAG: tRNA lysidine(34) synthetase TilS, partial [Burkholderiaceae bacterium]
HHADDQVETLLLNWGRGAGLTGMSGMQPRSLLEGIALLRPLLATQSDDIAMYAEQFKLSWVEDGSNQSLALRRNRVRHEVLPLLDEVFPGFRGNVLRHAALVAVAAEGSGKDDQTPVGPRFDRGQYRAQSDHALDALLHRWLKSMGQRAPTQARTRHLREQLFRSDSAYAQCQHDGAWLLRYRDEIQWLAQLPAPVNDEVSFSWQGERDLALPGFDGVLVFREAVEGEPGLPSSCLESAPLCVTSLRMNAQMRMVPGGVNRRLRLLCQEKGIPSWDRQRLPMLSRGQDVLFAAAIGLNHGFAKNEGSGRWQIEWRRSGKA